MGNSALRFEKAAIIGVGLIGGSLAMVLREKGIAGRITGVGRGIANLEAANGGVVTSSRRTRGEGVKELTLYLFQSLFENRRNSQKAALPKPGCR